MSKKGIEIQVIDAYSIKPIDADGIRAAAARTADTLVTVEDHWAEGGLGDAVAGELSQYGVRVHKLAVTKLPRSGKPEELIAREGIDAASIVACVEGLLNSP